MTTPASLRSGKARILALVLAPILGLGLVLFLPIIGFALTAITLAQALLAQIKKSRP
jgi:hypothetical protein